MTFELVLSRGRQRLSYDWFRWQDVTRLAHQFGWCPTDASLKSLSLSQAMSGPVKVSDDDALSLMLSIGACVIRLKRGKPLTRRQTTVVLLANEDFRLKGFTEYGRLDEAMLLARFCKDGGFDLLLQQGDLTRCD